ncbi:hypothetical protein SRHO_G00168550 [Serrasalmus rhombeus]
MDTNHVTSISHLTRLQERVWDCEGKERQIEQANKVSSAAANTSEGSAGGMKCLECFHTEKSLLELGDSSVAHLMLQIPQESPGFCPHYSLPEASGLWSLWQRVVDYQELDIPVSK